jgi:hypothetical protein
MLVSENKMDENEGILLLPAHTGLGYQCAGAFQRLGKRIQGLLPDPSFDKRVDGVPLKTFSLHDKTLLEYFTQQKPDFRSLIWAPHPYLSFNQSPPPELIEELAHLIPLLEKHDPLFHAILVLPRKTEPALLEQLRKSSDRASILLTPSCFGFRDQGLFDDTLAAFKKNPALLNKKIPSTYLFQEWPSISFAELAAHLVVCPHNERVVGKTILLEGHTLTLQDWQNSFVETFNVQKAPLLDRWATQLSSEHFFLETTMERLVKKPLSLSPSSTQVYLASEVFPTAPLSLQKSLAQHARSYARHPQLELVYTPARAL